MHNAELTLMRLNFFKRRDVHRGLDRHDHLWHHRNTGKPAVFNLQCEGSLFLVTLLLC
jgi:hypothetical protein